jgi:hypothetical protein
LFDRFGYIASQVLSSAQIAAEKANVAVDSSLENDFAIACEELSPHR